MMEKKYIIFMENTHGNLSYKIQGLNRKEKWSDLWYIFKPIGFDKTLAEMSEEERNNRIKYKSVNSLKLFAEWYKSMV